MLTLVHLRHMASKIMLNLVHLQHMDSRWLFDLIFFKYKIMLFYLKYLI